MDSDNCCGMIAKIVLVAASFLELMRLLLKNKFRDVSFFRNYSTSSQTTIVQAPGIIFVRNHSSI